MRKNPHKYPEVTGILLAGGQSRRMGQDKARLQFCGGPLYGKVLELMNELFPTIIIAGDRPDLIRPGIRAVPDIYPGSALGGLYTGLLKAPTEWIFAAPCDMPYPDVRIIELLLSERNGVAVVVPQTADGYEPIFALYHKQCLPYMETMLQQNRLRIYDLFPQVPVHYLESSQLPSGWQRTMININTPEDLNRITKEQS